MTNSEMKAMEMIRDGQKILGILPKELPPVKYAITINGKVRQYNLSKSDANRKYVDFLRLKPKCDIQIIPMHKLENEVSNV